jgi:Helix-turn-helix domain
MRRNSQPWHCRRHHLPFPFKGVLSTLCTAPQMPNSCTGRIQPIVATPAKRVAMGVAKHGRCCRGIRSRVGSIGRPSSGLIDEHERFWKAIARGVFTEAAAAVAGVSPAVGARWFRHGGGMSKSTTTIATGRYLSFVEREEIALLKARDYSVREIARCIGRSASTISRELNRNAATRSGYVEYRATTAHWHAKRRARRPKVAKLASNAVRRGYVQAKLNGPVTVIDGGNRISPGDLKQWTGRRHGPRQDRHWASSWSPQQIAARLPLDFPNDTSMQISHEAIYQALYIQGRAALSREL